VRGEQKREGEGARTNPDIRQGLTVDALSAEEKMGMATARGDERQGGGEEGETD